MSTQATIYYNKNVHIYVELIPIDEQTVCIEYHENGVYVQVKIMSFDDWERLGFPLAGTIKNLVRE